MDRIDILFKSGVGLIVSFISWLVGGLGLVFTVLLALLALDFITGIMVAIYQKQLNSNIGTKGLIKKTYIILLVGSTYLIELAVLKTNGIVTDGLSATFCIIEFVSITENGGKLGIPIPNKLRGIIATLKNQKSEV